MQDLRFAVIDIEAYTFGIRSVGSDVSQLEMAMSVTRFSVKSRSQSVILFKQPRLRLLQCGGVIATWIGDHISSVLYRVESGLFPWASEL